MFLNQTKNDELANSWDKVWLGSNYGNHELRVQRSISKIETLIHRDVKFFKGCKVLDAGCGDGTTLLLLKKRFGIEAFGIDVSKQALKRASNLAAQEGVEIQLLEADIRLIPYPSNFFDFILSWGVIEHFNNYGLAIEEFYRVLKHGGTLNLIQPNKLSFGGLQRKYLELTGKWESGGQIEFSGKFLEKLLIRKCFKNISYFAEPAFSDMRFVHYADLFINKLYKIWGHYLYVLASKNKESSVQRSIILIKPDAFQEGLVDEIFLRIQSIGDLSILKKEKFWATREKIEFHHSAHLFKTLGQSLLREKIIKYWLSGPMMRILVEGRDAIDRIHNLVGMTDPAKSPTNTLRYLSHDSLERADHEARAVRNLIHAPRSESEANRDISIWFE